MIRKKCDECGGKIVQKDVPYEIYGVLLGQFPAEVCQSCGEIIFTEETSRKMTALAKEKGLWGLEAKTTIGKVGDALDVRFPKRIVEFLDLKKGKEVWIHPEKKRIIIEL
jgi:YgiT-type zinc finger domain-containing protein